MESKEIARLVADAENRLKQLDERRVKILTELEDLRKRQKTLLKIREPESLFSQASVTKDSTADEKIALFRSLFRGREDTFALRWESSRSGKAGYQPACRNEWVKGMCRKPEIKCGECAARDLVPLTESVIRNHLKGFDPDKPRVSASSREFVVGLYPLLPDNTCYFLAADFDKDTWMEDISGFIETCREYEIVNTL
ncbi:MAG: restriction endonuclease subunit R, partial [Candidatus Aminicenantes bacterium]|nr:restriction endonuclease subunit R [Candidatus Aminicenantes bacterium]